MKLLNTMLALVAVVAGANADHVGQGTFYHPGLGACGKHNTDADHVVAVSAALFDSFGVPGGNPNNNPICGREVTIKFNGKSAKAKVVDRCAGCAGFGDLDMAPSVFKKLAPLTRGRIDGVHWHFDN